MRSGVLARWRRRVWVLRSLPPVARRWALRRLLEGATARAARLAAASIGEHGRLVFVCHGNIMRSAFATRVAQAAIPALAHRVVGGGTHAKAGRPAQDTALAVAERLGVPLTMHAATPLEALMLREHDVIVCMDAMNEANVLAAYPSLDARVFRVGDLVRDGSAARETAGLPDRELHDPYGKGEQVTHGAFDALRSLAVTWLEHVTAVHPHGGR